MKINLKTNYKINLNYNVMEIDYNQIIIFFTNLQIIPVKWDDGQCMFQSSGYHVLGVIINMQIHGSYFHHFIHVILLHMASKSKNSLLLELWIEPKLNTMISNFFYFLFVRKWNAKSISANKIVWLLIPQNFHFCFFAS